MKVDSNFAHYFSIGTIFCGTSKSAIFYPKTKNKRCHFGPKNWGWREYFFDTYYSYHISELFQTLLTIFISIFTALNNARLLLSL